MSKRKAVRVDHLADIPLDVPDMFLRLERRYWPDGTSCLHICKWSFQPKRQKLAPWWPLQYVQLPWWLVGRLVEVLTKAWKEAA